MLFFYILHTYTIKMMIAIVVIINMPLLVQDNFQTVVDIRLFCKVLLLTFSEQGRRRPPLNPRLLAHEAERAPSGSE